MTTYPQTWDELVSSTDAPRIYLAKVNYYYNDVESTLKVTTGGTFGGSYISKPTDTPANDYYKAGLEVPGSFTRTLFREGGKIGGEVTVSAGTLVLNNRPAAGQTTGPFDDLYLYAVDGRTVEILLGSESAPGVPWDFSLFRTISKGTAQSAVVGMEEAVIVLRDFRHLLDVPLQTAKYGGFGPCLSFDGVNDEIGFGDIHDFGATDSFTLEFRWRGAPSTNHNHVFLAKRSTLGAISGAGFSIWSWSGDNNAGGEVNLDDGVDIVTVTWTNGAGGSAGSLFDDAWHHFALVVDRVAQTASVYVDGVLRGGPTSIAAIGSLANAVAFYAGRNGVGGSFYEGDLDDIRVWTVARTQGEIVAAMGRPLNGDEVGLANYWKLDEATGTTAFSAVSGGNNGTISGASWVTSHEGGADLAGQTKARILGDCQNVEARCVDAQLGVYQFSPGWLKEISTVYWKGATKTGGGTDYTTDLRNGSITATVAVDGTVTGDVKGEVYGGYVEKPGDIMRRLLTEWSPLRGDCLWFDGTDDKVAFGDVFDQTGTFTAECWVRPQKIATAGIRLIAKDDGANGWSVSICDGVTHGTVVFVTRALSNAALASTAALRHGRWHHIACVYDAAAQTKTIYVDGVSVGSAATVTGSLVANATALELGSNQVGGAYYRGRMDEVRIWSTARTSTQIGDNMHVELVGTESGLVAYWQLNDKTGTTAAATTGGVNGALTGCTWIATTSTVHSTEAGYDFADINTLNPSVVGHSWKGDTTKLGALSEVEDGPGFYHEYTAGGMLRVGRVDDPGRRPKLGAAALYFNGVDSYVEVPHTAALLFGTAVTVQMWIRPERVDGSRVLFEKRLTGAEGWALRLVNGELWGQAWTPAGGEIRATGGTITPYEWTHVALRFYDGLPLNIWVDGVSVGDAVMVTTAGAENAANVYIGGSGGQTFAGLIDDVRLWHGYMRDADMALYYTAEAVGNEVWPAESPPAFGNSVLKGYWKLNEGSGATTQDTCSGNSDGALSSTAVWVRKNREIKAHEIYSIKPVETAIPIATQRVGYAPNFTVQQSDSLATGVTAARRAFLAEAFRYALDNREATVLATHPLAQRDLTTNAHFRDYSAAMTEAKRRGLLLSRDHRAYEVEAHGHAFSVEPGEGLRVTYPWREFAAGLDALVLDANDDPAPGQPVRTRLTVWA